MTKFGNMEDWRDRPPGKDAPAIRLRMAMEVLLIQHHFKVIKGQVVLRASQPRLNSSSMHKLLAERSPRALVGWRSFKHNSRFDVAMREGLRDFYLDLEEAIRLRLY